MRIWIVIAPLVLAACAGQQATTDEDTTTSSSTTSTSPPNAPDPEPPGEITTTREATTTSEPLAGNVASETNQIIFRLDPPSTFEENGLRLEVTYISFQSREDLLAQAEDDADKAFLEAMIEEQTQTIVRVEAVLANNSGETVSWHPSQGTLQIGSEQRDANPFLSPDEIGGNDILDGTEDDGLAIFEFRTPRDELFATGQARYVVGPAFDDDFNEVAGEADLTITWEP
jgi:hypothetical protein